MSFLKDIGIAIGSYGNAIEFMHKNHLKRYLLFPILFNLILFSTGIHFGGVMGDYILSTTETNLDTENWNFWGGEYLSTAFHFLLWIILKFFIFLLVAFIGGHLVLICLSPILAIVSEKTEQILTGKEYPFQFNQFLKDVIRGITMAIRNFLFELIFVVLLFALSFLPVIGFVTTPILFFISCFYYGFSFLDYSLERKRLNIKESSAFAKQNKGLTVGSGILFGLTLLLPFIGVALSAFIAIVSVVAATIAIHKKNLL